VARTQAADYDLRREAITDAAAALFAKKGFLGASVADLSAACHISKSLIYHYFPAKEDILFAVMWGHVSRLVELAKAMAGVKLPPEDKVRVYARNLMEVYNGAQAQQKILLNELENLPADKRALVVKAQREVIAVVDEWLVALRPALRDKPKQRRPVVMMFFGMLNWTHIWFDPDGAVSARQVADLAADMFLAGLPSK
jgi:AcrR family transcriptional regulator